MNQSNKGKKKRCSSQNQTLETLPRTRESSSMWIPFKSSQLKLPTPHLSTGKPLAVPIRRRKAVGGATASYSALNHAEKRRESCVKS